MNKLNQGKTSVKYYASYYRAPCIPPDDVIFVSGVPVSVLPLGGVLLVHLRRQGQLLPLLRQEGGDAELLRIPCRQFFVHNCYYIRVFHI